MSQDLFTIVYFRIRRVTLCRLGIHYHGLLHDGSPPNFCACCRAQINPNAYSSYVVTLSDGTQIDVKAVNKSHAMNQVVYGGSSGEIDARAVACGEVRVHPSNIASVVKVGDTA